MRVCIVLDSEHRKKYEHQELVSLWNSVHDVSMILVESSSPLNDSGLYGEQRGAFIARVKRIIDRKWFFLINLEERVAKWIKPDTVPEDEYRSLNSRVSIFESLPEARAIALTYFVPVKVGKILYEFPEDILNKIESSAEVVVFLGFNKIVRGGILQRPKYGVLSFHHADIKKYRGRPAGFHEWINDEHFVGTTLQRLTPDLDGGDVVTQRHADITGLDCYQQVLVEAMKLKGNMLVEGIDSLEKGLLPEVLANGSKPKLSTMRNSNTLSNVARCLIKNIKRRYFYGSSRSPT